MPNASPCMWPMVPLTAQPELAVPLVSGPDAELMQAALASDGGVPPADPGLAPALGCLSCSGRVTDGVAIGSSSAAGEARTLRREGGALWPVTRPSASATGSSTPGHSESLPSSRMSPSGRVTAPAGGSACAPTSSAVASARSPERRRLGRRRRMRPRGLPAGHDRDDRRVHRQPATGRRQFADAAAARQPPS